MCEWVEPWGTLHQEEEGNLGTGEEGSHEREEWGNPGLEQEGSSLELGGSLEFEEKEVPLGGCSRVGRRPRWSTIKPYS